MRDIKFRGWNTKHKKRIYGDLFRSRWQWFITQDGIVSNPLAEPNDWKVEPESVGQFTWILDKDGKEIYEGDILQDTKRSIKYLVVWNGSQASFELSNPKHHYDNLIFANKTYGRFEVVGNIYEDPELLNQ